MKNHDTPAAVAAPVPHPLAGALAKAVAGARPRPAILVLGLGDGRNLPVLAATGARVTVLEADPQRIAGASPDPRVRIVHAAYAGPYPIDGGFAAALTTHALLHGTCVDVARAVAAISTVLAPRAPFFLTLGSQHDARFGRGREVAADSFAPVDGAEAGVAHAYFSERGVRELMIGFDLESADEADAGATAGAWAHAPGERSGGVHWFVRARRCGS